MTEKEFAAKWVNEIGGGLLKKFPEDFIGNVETTEIKMPGMVLVLGTELFGKYEILDTSGNCRMHAGSFHEAKYIIYTNRNKPDSIPIPVNPGDIKNAVKEYEKHLDTFILAIEKDFKERFPKSKGLYDTVNLVFNSLNINRY